MLLWTKDKDGEERANLKLRLSRGDVEIMLAYDHWLGDRKLPLDRRTVEKRIADIIMRRIDDLYKFHIRTKSFRDAARLIDRLYPRKKATG